MPDGIGRPAALQSYGSAAPSHASHRCGRRTIQRCRACSRNANRDAGSWSRYAATPPLSCCLCAFRCGFCNRSRFSAIGGSSRPCTSGSGKHTTGAVQACVVLLRVVAVRLACEAGIDHCHWEYSIDLSGMGLSAIGLSGIGPSGMGLSEISQAGSIIATGSKYSHRDQVPPRPAVPACGEAGRRITHWRTAQRAACPGRHPSEQVNHRLLVSEPKYLALMTSGAQLCTEVGAQAAPSPATRCAARRMLSARGGGSTCCLLVLRMMSPAAGVLSRLSLSLAQSMHRFCSKGDRTRRRRCR